MLVGNARAASHQRLELRGSTSTLSAASSDPTQAFEAIVTGSFSIRAREQGSVVAGTTVQYSVDDLTVSVAGHLNKALF